MLKTQQGQVLPLGLALVLISVLATIVLYNTGRAINDKTKLANAADAAAYSGLLWQARALNFQAYTNRAMVANQVSIAQAVSLRSWTLYGRVTTDNMSTVLAAVPFVGALTQAMSTVMSTTEGLVKPIATAMISVVDGVNTVLSNSQEAMFLSSFAATPQVVKEVAFANDKRFSSDTRYGISGLGVNLDNWKSFTIGYDSKNKAAMRRRADVVTQSQDRFSDKRSWNFFKFWFPDSPFSFVRIYRDGKTELIEKETEDGLTWEWKAKDTISLNKRIWRPLKGFKRTELPVGWGEAWINEEGGDSIEEYDVVNRDYGKFNFSTAEKKDWFNRTRKSEDLADSGVISLKGSESRDIMTSNYSGLHAYRSLSDDIRSQEDPRLELRVEVQMPLSEARTANSNRQGNRFSTEMAAPGDVMSSVSIAEVFYEKPRVSSSEPLQPANGYNPYWDVRLKNVPNSERLLAVALRSSGGSSVAPNVESSSSNNGLTNYDDSTLVNVDTLASAIGVNSSDISGSELANTQFVNLDEDALKGHFSEEIDNIKGDIVDELEDELSESAKKILSGAAIGALNRSGIDANNLQSTYEQLEGKVNTFKDDAEEFKEDFDRESADAERAAEELRAEYDRIREDVMSEYGPKRDELYQEYGEKVLELRRELSEALGDRNKSHNTREQELAAENAVEIAQRNLDEAEDVLFGKLADELIVSMEGQSDLITIPRSAALSVVATEFRSTSDEHNVVNELGILDVLEDDADYEDDDPPDKEAEDDFKD